MQVFSTASQKTCIFSAFFAVFSLRSPHTLAIVPNGPGFSAENRGISLAACPARFGVESKYRRISRLDGSQANE
jgi:hypothetical protein